MKTWIALGLLAFAAHAVVARAQVGATTDIILGKVVNPEGVPMPGVSVRVVSTETQIGRNATTNTSGRFTVIFPDGGGNYRVTAKFVGYTPVTIAVNRAADEDRLMANITLGGSIPQLSTVRTTARRNQRGDAGGTGRLLTPGQVEKLPIDGSDPNALAALTPGVVGISATDTSGSAFSVAGQRPTLNSVTVDGTTFNGSTVPQEALRSTRVITNTYDVSRGQFTGGQVASTTRGGTNTAQGSFAYYFRNPALSFGNQGPTAFSQLRNQNQLSGGFGGPIVKDRVFSFSAFQLTRRSDDVVDLLNATPQDLTALGLSPDSVAKFIQALRAKGVPLTAPGVPAQRVYENLTLFQRLDFIIDDNNSLLVRGDFRGRLQDGTRINPNTLPTVGGHVDAAGGGLLLALTSHFGRTPSATTRPTPAISMPCRDASCRCLISAATPTPRPASAPSSSAATPDSRRRRRTISGRAPMRSPGSHRTAATVCAWARCSMSASSRSFRIPASTAPIALTRSRRSKTTRRRRSRARSTRSPATAA
jgi:hypothetical protein